MILVAAAGAEIMRVAGFAVNSCVASSTLLSMGWLLRVVMRSPRWMPAFSAALCGAISRTSRPGSSDSPTACSPGSGEVGGFESETERGGGVVGCGLEVCEQTPQQVSEESAFVRAQ
jgi:hypothetical protein